jgi:hypothetical protein
MPSTILDSYHLNSQACSKLSYLLYFLTHSYRRLIPALKSSLLSPFVHLLKVLNNVFSTIYLTGLLSSQQLFFLINVELSYNFETWELSLSTENSLLLEFTLSFRYNLCSFLTSSTG